jgi:hypothetical protein
LVEVQRIFALNKTELARVCRVTRPTIYDWFSQKFEAEEENRARLAALFRIAQEQARDGLPPLSARVIARFDLGGASLVDLLAEEVLNQDRIRNASWAIAGAMRQEAAQGARGRRERLGWKPLSEETKRETLERNLDDFLDD